MITSKSYCLSEEVEDSMSNKMLVSNACLLALVKKTKDLDTEAKVREIRQPWPRVDKYTTDIIACLQQSTSNSQIISIKTELKLLL